LFWSPNVGVDRARRLLRRTEQVKRARDRTSVQRRVQRSPKSSSADDKQYDKGHQIKQHDSYLEDRHSDAVKGIELIARQAKPSAVDALNPIVREHEDQEPNQQHSVIDGRTP
jgi:hypothetical protein